MKTTCNKIIASIAVIIILIGMLIFIHPVLQNAIAGQVDNKDPSIRLSNIIRFLDNLLRDKDLSNESRETIELRKQNFEWQTTQLAIKPDDPEQIIAQKQTLAVEATHEFLLTTPATAATRPVGILYGIDTIRSLAKEASISDIFWVGKVDNVYNIFYTGALKEDPLQGVIYVFPENIGSWLKFLTPNKSGAVTISKDDGNRLFLMSGKGEIFYFDVAAQNFKDESGNPLFLAPKITVTPIKPYP